MYGVKGVMNGAAIIFFAYLGYDAVATLAEEVRPMTSNASLYGIQNLHVLLAKFIMEADLAGV